MSSKHLELAQKSQDVVANFLVEKGFTISCVSDPSSNGVDIVAIKDGKNFAIEVKTASYSERSWRVTKPNKCSDYIAIVMPNGWIHFDSLDAWSKTCAKDGTRRITKILNFYAHL